MMGILDGAIAWECVGRIDGEDLLYDAAHVLCTARVGVPLLVTYSYRS